MPGVFTERGRMYMRFGKPAYRKIADMPAQRGQHVWLTARLGGW